MPAVEDVEVVPREAVDPRLTAAVHRHVDTEPRLEVLDAGCGRMWTWDLGPDVSYRLTGVDDDEDALRLRVRERGDLDEWVVGDLRTVSLQRNRYDIVHSAYVLEHVAGARDVLERMYDAARPGGLIVLKTPDRDSVYAFITRITPHWLHVQYKRRIRRKPLAGTSGHGPYRVVYDDVLSLPLLLQWADGHRMEVVDIMGENGHLDFFGRAAPAVDGVLRAVAALSRGRLTANHTNVAVVLRKPVHVAEHAVALATAAKEE